MSNEMTVYESNQDIAIYRPPEIVLAEAQKAAKSLAQVVSGKKKPVIMNGEQYLEFEDWQTVGRFYGVTAKVVSTTFIDYGNVQGFEAKAVALRADGMEISAAESMCLNDEPNWQKKPLFQLRSMAQTRACAKALRNVLAWVVVLAGYKPTPAEEMTGQERGAQASGGNGGIKEPQKKGEGGEAAEQITALVKNIFHDPGEKNGKKYVKHTVIDMNDVRYTTFSDTLAGEAAKAKDSGAKVKIGFNTGKFGREIVTLEIDVPEEG